jgi:hypothetical protein
MEKRRLTRVLRRAIPNPLLEQGSRTTFYNLQELRHLNSLGLDGNNILSSTAEVFSDVLTLGLCRVEGMAFQVSLRIYPEGVTRNLCPWR